MGLALLVHGDDVVGTQHGLNSLCGNERNTLLHQGNPDAYRHTGAQHIIGILDLSGHIDETIAINLAVKGREASLERVGTAIFEHEGDRQLATAALSVLQGIQDSA